MSHEILTTLYETIISRKGADPADSYVADLFSRGRGKIAQKLGEEAVETCIEALQDDRDKLAAESADLLFHLMILWADAGLTPDEVLAILDKRRGLSGHEEKRRREPNSSEKNQD